MAGRVDRWRRAVQDRARAGAQASARDDSRGASWSARPTIRARLARRARFRKRAASETCAIVGQNAEPDARAELRTAAHAADRARSAISPSATATASSGSRSIFWAAAPVPPAMFVKHQMITRENVDHLYPNDALLGVERFARF